MAVQALVLTLVFLIASQFAFVQSLTNKILTGVTLGLAIVFGLVLIESVKFEVRRKTEELALANSRLRKLDNAKSEFITIASHKLRTPMTAIKGFASMLLEGAYGKLEDKPKDVLTKIYMSNDRLITLAEDLLNVSKIESGKMDFVFEKVDLPALTQEVYDTFFIQAKDKNLTLTLNPPLTPLPEVTTDRKKLREVISDIVDNAIRYTPEGEVTIRFYQDDSFLTIAVQDTGIGISEEEAVSLFTKFARGKDVSKINTEGNGLSLHVTRSILEALGGRITFSSEGKGKGSTFNVMVPLRGKRDKRG
jgi:signal transduction histidine kinase